MKQNKMVVLGLVLLIYHAALGSLSGAAEPLFDGLKSRLIKDGFTKEQLKVWFDHRDAAFNVSSVGAFFRHSEGRLNYDQFLSGTNIAKARRYMATHQPDLLAADKQFGVAAEVITAIVLVETRLGTYLGKSNVFSTLSTMAALRDQGAREKLWREMPSKGRYDRNRFDQKADQRAPWAYKELKAFLRYTHASGIDPLQIEGSYAGAMGICQFMPSNIAKFGMDGNGDGRINLFDHTDAIYSVARYLQKHGWKSGLNEAEAMQVVKRYNLSTPYARTVLGVARKLKQ